MQKKESAGCLDQFIALCKKFELKITPQRCAIFKILAQIKDHPTADEMYHLVKGEFPNISYDTVNRTLLTFAQIGLIDVVPTQEGPRRFDPDMEQHHHFHCIQCGKIIDFYSNQMDNIKIPEHILEEYRIFSRRIVLNGLCKQCRSHKERINRKSANK